MKAEWYEHDFLTYFDDLRYEEFTSDMDSYFKGFRLINLYIINHECRGTPLQNSEAYYKTIKSRDLL